MSQFKLKIIWPSPNMSRVASADNRKKYIFFSNVAYENDTFITQISDENRRLHH
jgi:hypothetical protein